ncbi:AMP-binding enzyme [Massilia sp. DWR3-1-1]|uniref:AMP-binding enzyme n=1 Tax=Massilia sp. DWR3-1-1 TaxID=2804559 RepID=UPI003CF0E8F3
MKEIAKIQTGVHAAVTVAQPQQPQQPQLSQQPHWWRAPGALQRFTVDLIDGELARLRPGRGGLRVAGDGAPDLVADLGADSLELMALTAALAEVLQLPQAGMLDALLADSSLDAWVAVLQAALEQPAPIASPARLGFRSSGSSGLPTSSVHPLAHLWQEVAALAPLLPGRRRIVSAVPCHHIYGFLWTVLLPQLAGPGRIVPVVDVRGQVAAGVWQALLPGDLVIGYPEFWQAALAGAGLGQCAADVVGVSSTAPCPQDLAERLQAAGLARLVQIYGSSETAGVGWRDGVSAPYRCLPYWQRVDKDDARLVRRMPDGSASMVRLPDRLVWQDDCHFALSGRVDAAVQVGGINVFPQRVAALLREHPAVVDAAVRLMRPDEGTRLKAYIATASGASPATLAQQLGDYVRQHLAPAERPASFTFGTAVPRQRNGKLADWVIDGD